MSNCLKCKWAVITGGDLVPYGAGSAQLPEYVEECENILLWDDDAEDYVTEFDDYVEGKKVCPHFTPSK